MVVYDGPDIDGPASHLIAEFFVVDDIAANNLVIAEGSLVVVAEDRLGSLSGKLTPLTRFALDRLLELRAGKA